MPWTAPVKCCIKGCKSTRKNNKLCHFPLNDKQKRKWVQIISLSDPEFAQKEDSKLVNLGVCYNHFTPDQFGVDGKRKKLGFPNKITEWAGEVPVPMVLYYSDSDMEQKTLKKRIQSPEPTLQNEDSDSDTEMKNHKTEIQEELCKLCLGTGVKMFSLNSEPLKQYYQFIEPCIDEFELIQSENFPTTVCYLCANSLRTCYQFGKLCAQSQSVLTEFNLIYSKIDIQQIKTYEKNKSKLRDLNNISLPNISIDATNLYHKDSPKTMWRGPLLNEVPNLSYYDSETPTTVATAFGSYVANAYGSKQKTKAPNIKQKSKEIVFDVGNAFGFDDLESPTHGTVIEDDQMSVDYLDEDDLTQNESTSKISTLKDYYEKVDLATTESETLNILPPITTQSHKPSTSISNKGYNPTIKTQNVPSSTSHKDQTITTKKRPLTSISNKEYQTQMKSKENQSRVYSSILSKQNVLLYGQGSKVPSKSPATPICTKAKEAKKSPASKDDVVFVDVTNATQDIAAETPILSEATINTLKKTLSKSHGEVEVKRMYYEGDNINVIMVNSQGKQVLLKLSRTDNLQPAAAEIPKSTTPSLEPPVVNFNNNCWTTKALDEKEQNMQIYNRKWSRAYLKAPFKCTTCFKWFHIANNYSIHIKKHDPNSGEFYCGICKMYFAEEKKLMNHQRTHNKLYTCKLCPVSFCSIISAKEHQRVHIVYQCSICKKEFRLLADFNNHASEHRQEIYEEYTADDLTPLTKYQVFNVLPPKIRKWSATCCGENYVYKPAYKRHCRLKHPESFDTTSELVMCEQCGVLVDKCNLAYHRKAHLKPKGPYRCKLCPRIERTEGKLERHMMMHSNERPHLCFKCAKSFRKKENLRDHLLKCGTEEAKKSELRKFSCEVCGRRFFQNHTLRTHILAVHLGIKHSKKMMLNKQNVEVEGVES